jgi:hypothetical protein
MEERTGGAAEEEDGGHDEQCDQSRVAHRAAHLERGPAHDARDRHSLAWLAAVTEPRGDLLAVGDGVANDRCERRDQAGHRQSVDRSAGEVEDEQRGDERQRDRDEADHDRPPAQHQGGERERHEDRGDEDREAQVRDRVVDERRGPEDGGIDPHAAQTGSQLGERSVELARERSGVGAGQLLDDEQEAVVRARSRHDRVADQRLVVLDHAGDVAERKRRPRRTLDRHLREVVRGAERQYVADAETLVVAVDEAASAGRRRVEERQRGDELRVTGRLHDLQQRDVPLAQPAGIDQDLELTVAVAPQRDVRDARDPHQPGADGPASKHRELDRRQSRRRQPDHHHAVRRRDGLDHLRRRRHVRDRLRLGEPLCDELPGAEDVGPALEEERDRRQAGDRVRADRLDALDPVEQVLLEGHGQQLLDLRRRQAEALGLDLDGRLRVLRQDVDARRTQLPDGDDHERHGDRDHEQPEPEACVDDRADHG